MQDMRIFFVTESWQVFIFVNIYSQVLDIVQVVQPKLLLHITEITNESCKKMHQSKGRPSLLFIAPSDIVHRPFDITSSRREEIVHGS